MKINLFRKQYILFFATLGIITFFSACNEKDEPTNEVNTQNVASVAISRFALDSDKDIMSGLDSVFFSIDMKNGVIFNADSLPKGTNITALKTKIEFDQPVSQILVTMEGGEHRTGTTDLSKISNDTIDFTGKVTMEVTSSDGSVKFKYLVKVNVHQSDPDSLTWDKMAVRQLPSRMQNPVNQKTVRFGDKIYCLINEKDGSHTLSTTDTLDINNWDKQAVTLGFTPRIRTLTSTDKALYMLDSDSNLLSSTDGKTWSATGKKWIGITGGYGEYLLGIKGDAQNMRHTSYPDNNILHESAVESDFPISDTSNFVYFSNKWSTIPIGFLCGGRDFHGRISDSTWAFDGETWTRISQNPAPALTDANIIYYYAYRRLNNQSKNVEYRVWMMLGGKTEDGTFNRNVYISFDNGVNWQKGSDYLQLPQYIPAMTELDNIVLYSPKSGSIAGWKTAPRHLAGTMHRLKYDIDGDQIFWECPYIYLFGGRLQDGNLSNTIWRGVLNRLTFVPII